MLLSGIQGIGCFSFDKRWIPAGACPSMIEAGAGMMA
jgi:hypothetical protein